MKLLCIKASIAFYFVALSCSAWATTLPFYAQPAKLIADLDPNANNSSRLKVSIASEFSVFDSEVLVGQLVACSETACFKPDAAPIKLSLSDTRAGTSETVVQFVIPRVKITSLHFESIAGPKVVTGDISVTSPIQFDQEYFAEDILVIVKKSGSGATIKYAPIEAVSGFVHPSRQTIYYSPSVATVAKLNFGASLSIPAHATVGSKLLSVAVNDIREDFPMIDIYPEIKLNSEATISAVRIRENQISLPITNSMLESREVKNKKLTQTGVITFDEAGSTIRGSGAAKPFSLAPKIVNFASETDTCVGYLNDSASDITSGLATTGTVYINSCLQTSPNVHIAVSNVLDARERGSLAYKLAPSGSYELLTLQTIPVMSPGSQVAINGFTWVGDNGYGPGVGLANGFVENDGITLANNIVGGGLRPDRSAPQDNLKVATFQQPNAYALWTEGNTAPIFVTNQLAGFVVGSSTSILKNGSCTNDSTDGHWSAIGSTPGGRLIFVSSTSTNSTNAKQLCPIFAALGANYAIRLDGASAAGIAIDGVLLNPNTGGVQLVTGTARHIAYAIVMKYPASKSATTPTITIPSRRRNPPPPCSVNPQSCAEVPVIN